MLRGRTCFDAWSVRLFCPGGSKQNTAVLAVLCLMRFFFLETTWIEAAAVALLIVIIIVEPG